MSPDEYLTQRVQDQIDWYDRKSQLAQRWFRRMRTLEILFAAAIPILVGFAAASASLNFVVAVLGGAVVVLAALLSLNQYQENWLEYRTTCESLKTEKYLFLTLSDPYHGDEPFPLFVQRVEGLLSKEHQAWAANVLAAAQASRPGEEKPEASAPESAEVESPPGGSSG